MAPPIRVTSQFGAELYSLNHQRSGRPPWIERITEEAGKGLYSQLARERRLRDDMARILGIRTLPMLRHAWIVVAAVGPAR